MHIGKNTKQNITGHSKEEPTEDKENTDANKSKTVKQKVQEALWI